MTLSGAMAVILCYFIVSDIAIFVFKRDVKRQLTNLRYFSEIGRLRGALRKSV